MLATGGLKQIGFFLQNARDFTENIKSENPEISGRKIFRTAKPKAFNTQARIKKIKKDLCTNFTLDYTWLNCHGFQKGH